MICCDDSLYCGITTDIERCIKQHNGELMSREYEIKKWKKVQKEALLKKAKIKDSVYKQMIVIHTGSNEKGYMSITFPNQVNVSMMSVRFFEVSQIR